MGTLAGQPSGWAAGARFARLMHRTSNPIVIALLRSPLHWPLSRSVLLITVRGRRTGRPYTLPVVYAKIGSTILIVPGDPEHKTWWRNLREPATVELLLRGREVTGVGRAIRAQDDLTTVADAMRDYLAAFPPSAAQRGLTVVEHEVIDDETTLRAAVANDVIVRVDLDAD
ncbi:MAG TPA: nitroreductase/quinone reductase family protein [Pseudonocardiaceae bacterium]